MRLALGVVWLGALLVFVAGWVHARRAGDGTARVDARVVLAIGAIIAAGAAFAVETRYGSTGAATIVFAALLVAALAGYVYVAARGPAGEAGPDQPGRTASPRAQIGIDGTREGTVVEPSPVVHADDLSPRGV